MEHERKFKSFIENADVGIFSFNNENDYKEINSKFCGMIGYDRNEMFDYKFPEPFWPIQFYSRVKDDIELYKQTGLLKIETFFRRKNDTYFPVYLSGSIIPKSGDYDVEYAILMEDRSEQKKAEREFKLSKGMLVSLNNKLEKLVKKRTKQLQLVMKQKNEFINQLGHDLKNPLTPLISLIPVLYKKTPDDECKEIIAILKRNVAYMQNLIVNTIELAKLDSLKIPFSFELVNLKQEIDSTIRNNFKEIDSIIHDNLTMHNEKNITIFNRVDNDIYIELDKLRLNELIINLVGNAVKYGKENGSVNVIGEKDDDNSIQIKIIDDGIGMNQDQLRHVFNDFYRVNRQNSNFKSSGLGMSICKRIVEKHGGTINCESQGLGKGTTVICILPIKHNLLEDEQITQKMENVTSSIKNEKINA